MEDDDSIEFNPFDGASDTQKWIAFSNVKRKGKDAPSSTNSQFLAQQQIQRDMEVAALDQNLADVMSEASTHIRSESLPFKRLNGGADESMEDPASANYMNAIALKRDVRPDTRILAVVIDNTSKRKRKEDHPVSIENRSTVIKLPSTKEQTPEGKSPEASTGRKLKRPAKARRQHGRLSQRHIVSQGDMYAVPEDRIIHTAVESADGARHDAYVDQPASNTMKSRNIEEEQLGLESERDHPSPASKPLDAKPSVTANMRSSRTRTTDTSKAAARMAAHKNKHFAQSSPVNPNEKRQTDPPYPKQATPDDRLESTSHSKSRNLRRREKPRILPDIVPTKESKSESEKRSHSPSGGEKQDRLAEEEVEDSHSIADDIGDDGNYISDIPKDNPEDGNMPSSDESDQGSADSDAGNVSRHPSVEANLRSIQLNVFQETERWDTIIAAVHMVGVSQVKGERHEGKPKLRTRVIKGMIRKINNVRNTYKKLLERDGQFHNDIDEFHQELKMGLSRLEATIDMVSEKDDAIKSPQIVRDIYAHAIPRLVELLEVALRCRTAEYSRQQDTIALVEIIRLQDDTIKLCKKARAWKAKPNTTRPIIQPTIKILAYLRDIRKTFISELDKRQRAERLKTADRRRLELARIKNDKLLRGKEEIKKSTLENRKRIGDQLDRHEATRAASNRIHHLRDDPNNFDEPQDLHTCISDSWTNEQDHELLQRLQWKPSRYLPGLYSDLPLIDAH